MDRRRMWVQYMVKVGEVEWNGSYEADDPTNIVGDGYCLVYLPVSVFEDDHELVWFCQTEEAALFEIDDSATNTTHSYLLGGRCPWPFGNVNEDTPQPTGAVMEAFLHAIVLGVLLTLAAGGDHVVQQPSLLLQHPQQDKIFVDPVHEENQDQEQPGHAIPPSTSSAELQENQQKPRQDGFGNPATPSILSPAQENQQQPLSTTSPDLDTLLSDEIKSLLGDSVPGNNAPDFLQEYFFPENPPAPGAKLHVPVAQKPNSSPGSQQPQAEHVSATNGSHISIVLQPNQRRRSVAAPAGGSQVDRGKRVHVESSSTKIEERELIYRSTKQQLAELENILLVAGVPLTRATEVLGGSASEQDITVEDDQEGSRDAVERVDQNGVEDDDACSNNNAAHGKGKS